jgi:hypothetical protein
VLSTVLGATFGAVVASLATWTLSGGGPTTRDQRLKRVLFAFRTAWPGLLVIAGFWIAYGQNPSWDFPSDQFYVVAAEVNVLLLLGLLIESRALGDLHRLHRLEYGAIMMLGEAAALLKASGSAGDESDFLKVLLSTLTITSLLSAAILLLAAVGHREKSPPDDERPGFAVSP